MNEIEKLKQEIKVMIQSRKNSQEFPPYNVDKDFDTEDYFKIAKKVSCCITVEIINALKCIESKVDNCEDIFALERNLPSFKIYSG